MRHLFYPRFNLLPQFKKVWHNYSFIALLLISVVALMACGPTATPSPTAPPTQPPATQAPVTEPTPVPTEQPTPTPQMVEEPAPVESVAIEVVSTDPVAAEMVLVTGLPSGCVSFNGYDLQRQDDSFEVTVTNVRPDQDDLVCTMIYGMHTTRIPLEGEIEVCGTYTVVVNGETFSVQAMVPGEECDGGQEPPMIEEPAPIENVSIEAEATDPVRANLVVVSGLPNACYSFGRYDISRDGDTFEVQVINVKPDDPNLACAEIYRTVITEVPLPGEVEICQTYTVNINGQSHSLQVIGPTVQCPAPADETRTEVTLGMGETETVGDGGLQLTFLEVTEDSRCPSDVQCIQAGQATVNIKVEMDGQELGTVSLTLGGDMGSASQTLEGYTFELTGLDPSPISTMDIQPEDYVAQVSVTRG